MEATRTARSIGWLLPLLLAAALCSCSTESFCKRTEQVAETSAQVLGVLGFPGELANAATLEPLFAAVCGVARTLGGVWDQVLGLFGSQEPAAEAKPPAAEQPTG